MNLNDAFAKVAAGGDIDPRLLLQYAEEDEVGGIDTGWPTGSLFSVEGKLLYALTRVLKPRRVLELGSWYGCSSAHFLAALDRNGEGELISMDRAPIVFNNHPRWKVIIDEIHTVKLPVNAEIILEDLGHDYEGTKLILERLHKGPRRYPQIMLSHDAMHFMVGEGIRRAWTDFYGADKFETVLIEPADCGFAWRWKR